MSRRSTPLLLTMLACLCFARPDAARGQRAESEEAVASFTGGIISVADMEASIALKLPETRERLASLHARKEYLDELVRYDLLALEAERRGYGRNPLVEEATHQAAIDAWLAHEDAAALTQIGDAEVTRYYEAHVDQFRPAPLRRASQVFVTSEPAARALITQLGRATPEEFARMASALSQDPRTARQGGELGFFDATGKPAEVTQSPVPAAIAAAVFALASGGPAIGNGVRPPTGGAPTAGQPPQLLPQPVRLAEGFSVVMWTGEKSREPVTLAQVSDAIRAALAVERAGAQRDAILSRIHEMNDEQRSPIRYDLVEQLELAPEQMPDILAGHSAAPVDPRAPPVEMESDGI